MQLNPHNFRKHLTRPAFEPQAGAWLICAMTLAFVTWWNFPFIVPEAVALNLPRTQAVSLKNPPSAFVVFTGNNFIYQNRAYNLDSLKDTLRQAQDKKLLILAAAASVTLEQILPVLDKLEGLGFDQVAFTVKP